MHGMFMMYLNKYLWRYYAKVSIFFLAQYSAAYASNHTWPLRNPTIPSSTLMICHGIFRSCSDMGGFGIVFLPFPRPVVIDVPVHTIVGLPRCFVNVPSQVIAIGVTNPFRKKSVLLFDHRNTPSSRQFFRLRSQAMSVCEAAPS